MFKIVLKYHMQEIDIDVRVINESWPGALSLGSEISPSSETGEPEGFLTAFYQRWQPADVCGDSWRGCILAH